MSNETLSFKCEGFAEDICDKLDENFLFSNFTDVTLVSDDGKYFRAHKIVLSTASPILKDILLLQFAQEPIIYFPSVQKESLKALLDYMYLGNASISFQNAEAFTELAIQMKLTGFVNTAIMTSAPENLMNNDIFHQTDTIPGNGGFEELIMNKEMGDFDIDQTERPTTEIDCDDKKTFVRNKQIEVEKDTVETFLINSGTKRSARPSEISSVSFIDLNRRNKSGHKLLQCMLCDYKNVKKKLEEHNSFKHEGKGYKCDACDYKAESKHSVKEHKATKHEGKRYSCANAECSYVAISKGQIRNHKRVVHEGFRYSCEKCEFKCTTRKPLKNHINVIHNRKRIVCDECGHVSKTQKSDKLHRRAKHENVEYKCEFCDFVAGWPYNLKKHKNKQHLKIAPDFFLRKMWH